MKKNLLYAIAIAIFTSVTFTACSDDDNNSPSNAPKPSELPKPSITEKTTLVTLPETMTSSTDPNVQSITGMVQSLNSISYMSAALQIPENATVVSGKKSTGSYSYKWTDDTETIYLDYTETASEKSWTIYVQESGKDKIKVLYAQEAADGKSGKFEYYDAENKNATYKWSWTILASGTKYHFTATGNEYIDDMTIDATVNTDGSGTLDLAYSSQGFEFTYNAVWDKEGHGSLTVKSNGQTSTVEF